MEGYKHKYHGFDVCLALQCTLVHILDAEPFVEPERGERFFVGAAPDKDEAQRIVKLKDVGVLNFLLAALLPLEVKVDLLLGARLCVLQKLEEQVEADIELYLHL